MHLNFKFSLSRCQGRCFLVQEKYKKKIDWVFFNEGKIKKAVQDARIDTPKPEKVIGDPNKISDPTAQTAINNLTPLSLVYIGDNILKYPEHWLTVICRTYNWCKRQSETHFQAVRKKYLGENYLKICREVNVSCKTLYNMIAHARQYAALQAVQFGLIYIN